VANKIATQPAFSWWVPLTLKKRTQIIAAVNNRYHQRTQKFGIQVPKSVAEALAIDQETGTNFWSEAIASEATNVDVAFQNLAPHQSVPVGYQFVKCHMIFDFKVGSLKRNARYVAGSHMTKPPAAATYYASVIC
jgi:hypothetical protein